MNDDNNIPSKEEHMNTLINKVLQTPTMSAPKYRCPSCQEGGMCRNETILLCSYPPQYQYECDKCGHIDVHWG